MGAALLEFSLGCTTRGCFYHWSAARAALHSRANRLSESAAPILPKWQVLDQFERNEDQQQFILTIFETLDKRSLDHPKDFDSIPLTDLSDVAQNGVQTISSVHGEGMQLCEHAMTTLLQTYITKRNPDEWKSLFKEATNIGFMVKYMFRENLPLAKTKFAEAVGNKDNYKKMPKPGEVQEALKELAGNTMSAYGDVGIFDP